MTKKALITGISGQDGAYLAQYLLKENYKVIGAERHTASGSLWRLDDLKIKDEIEIKPFELAEYSNIKNVIQSTEPDEIYNLAAQSFVASSFDMPLFTSDVTGLGVMRILDAIKEINKDIKFYQASSSEMFGKVQSVPQNENTMFYPRSPYAVAKLFGHWATVNYRESFDIFACSGILFNHESPLRGENFVTKKITSSLCRIVKEKQKILELGNLDSRRDWGYAGDYIHAMHLMLQHKEPDDYVIATGTDASVREFVQYCCDLLDINLYWEGNGIDEVGIDRNTKKTIIKINPKYYRPAEVDTLLGDSSKAEQILNWKPKTPLQDLVKMMIDYDLKKV